MSLMEYRGYVGSVEYSPDDHLLFGKVQGIRSLLSYEGTTVAELEADFRGCVDDYFALCKDQGIAPEKPYKGSFNVRIPSDLHRRAVLMADREGTTLNQIVETALMRYVSD